MQISDDVSSEGLRHAVRVSLGLAKIVEKLNLSAISVSDANDELHAVLKCRPCLYLPSVFERGVVVSSEGDLMGTVAQLFLTRLSGEPTIFTEIFTYDKSKNEILVGQSGSHLFPIACLTLNSCGLHIEEFTVLIKSAQGEFRDGARRASGHSP